jgi:hypothetical protein
MFLAAGKSCKFGPKWLLAEREYSNLLYAFIDLIQHVGSLAFACGLVPETAVGATRQLQFMRDKRL